MLDAVKRIALTIALVLVAFLVGCTSLFSVLEMDSTVALEPHAVGISSQITTTMSAADRIGYRVARESSYYSEVSDAIRPGSDVCIERPAANVQIVVFELEPNAASGIEDGFVVYPFVAFVIDFLSREVVEVYKVTPMLSERLMTIESLPQRTTIVRELSDGIVEELELARARRVRGTPARPKDYLCNPDGYSYVLCVCTDKIPAHYLPGYDACREDCTNNPGFGGYLLCLTWCWLDHWVPAGCGEYTCTLIMPCDPT